MIILPKYALITPARNEAKFIDLTLRSVTAQTIRPEKWVIVSDGSTDGTDEIVSNYTAKYPWIELVQMPARVERHFAGKVLAFNAGYARLKDVPYEVIASLDADISFEKNYFEFLLRKLADDRALGLVGTPFLDSQKESYDYRYVSIEHVSGACQVFRRECFEEIGGYVPIKGGGIDHVAVITARMKGWKTRTFPDQLSTHHRDMGTAQRSSVMARFKFGMQDYALGGHPLWEIFRTCYQMTQRPLVLGGLMVGSGYFWAMVRRAPRPVSDELVVFRQREQMQRLKNFLTRTKVTRGSPLSRPVQRA